MPDGTARTELWHWDEASRFRRALRGLTLGPVVFGHRMVAHLVPCGLGTGGVCTEGSTLEEGRGLQSADFFGDGDDEQLVHGAAVFGSEAARQSLESSTRLQPSRADVDDLDSILAASLRLSIRDRRVLWGRATGAQWRAIQRMLHSRGNYASIRTVQRWHRDAVLRVAKELGA